MSLHSRRVLNGVAKGLGTYVSTESKGQSVSTNDKVPGIWWLSPIETSFTALRARSLKSRCSRDSSPPSPQPCFPVSALMVPMYSLDVAASLQATPRLHMTSSCTFARAFLYASQCVGHLTHSSVTSSDLVWGAMILLPNEARG